MNTKNSKNTKKRARERGVTLLVAILVVGVVLSIGTAILNITLKQFILSGISRDSAVAFYAADAGLECGKYWDRSEAHFVGANPSDITCFGAGHDAGTGSGGVYQIADMDFGDGDGGSSSLCTSVTVTKYYSDSGNVQMTDTRICPEGFTCTKIESRGYNKDCESYDSTPRTVERALRANYGGCRDLNQNGTCDVDD